VRRASYLASIALLATVVVSAAWMSDDAYITLRTIDNWRSGYGLRWNVAERVQSYTHPLWLLAEAAAWQLTGEPYFSSLGLSIVCALAGVLLLTARSRGRVIGVAAVLLLAVSQTFVDYATSGLETPLTYLLVAGFLAAYWKKDGTAAAPLGCFALGAALAINRLDAVVLVAPALAHVLYTRRDRWGLAVLGFAPLVAWETFSLVYYGFPVPNTAYAKLATGIPQAELTAQGLAYLSNSWRMDPVALAAIGAAIGLALWRPRAATATIAAGLALHLVYVIRVGGDFMSGRFLAPALIAAVGVLLQHPVTSVQRGAVAALMFLMVVIRGPTANARLHVRLPVPLDVLVDASGIADERLAYFRDTGLTAAIRRRAAPHHPWELAGRQARALGVTVMSLDSVGLFGYGAGPGVHIVDILALCDPLLARLPARRPWRIGHFYRDLPAGYMETLQGQQAGLPDPGLDEYYAALRLVTRGPLWSRPRWAAIARLNLRDRIYPALK
jgi:arabinofuranosyltransferase